VGSGGPDINTHDTSRPDPGHADTLVIVAWISNTIVSPNDFIVNSYFVHVGATSLCTNTTLVPFVTYSVVPLTLLRAISDTEYVDPKSTPIV